MILSLDCSTHSTGWALFKDKELVDYGCITSQKSNVFENIFTIIAGIDKVLEKYPDFDNIIMEEVLPKNEAYDDNGIHHAKPSVFKPLMWLQAAVNFLVYKKYKNIKIDFIFPNSWRSKVGIKTGRGIGRDTLKKADCQFALDTFGLKVNDDIADALGVGWSQINPKEEIKDVDWR